jgi:hypothetical protein
MSRQGRGKVQGMGMAAGDASAIPRTQPPVPTGFSGLQGMQGIISHPGQQDITHTHTGMRVCVISI